MLLPGEHPEAPAGSDFPPLIESDPLIGPLLPTRIELVNGTKLQKWLKDLSEA
jgi:hypothetical protein